VNILSPLSRLEEVEPLIEDGATCFYAGVMPLNWRDRFTNMASPNRREWKSSNFLDYESFGRAIRNAADHHVPVFMTLNTLYTESQYGMIDEMVERARDAGVEALIVADVGMFLHLAEMDTGMKLHASTGATIFNARAAKFFARLGATRITLPRHNTVEELCSLTEEISPIPTDVFVLNSGCKNIDGFCTFHHGENEVEVGKAWDILKNAGADHYVLEYMRKLPEWMSQGISDMSLFGSICACFLPYQVRNISEAPMDDSVRHATEKNIRKSFNFLSAMDHCAACAIPAFKRAGVDALKIVGRNHPTVKKRKDVQFLKAILDLTERYDDNPPPAELVELHRVHFGGSCEGLCYYPEAD
jgi:U32 family peptidase